MNKKNRRMEWIFLCTVMILLCMAFPTVVKASNKAVMSDGNIVFETIDTKATSNICWKTAGFSIRKDKSGGNPQKDKNYAVVLLKKNYREVSEVGGTYHITYTIPKKQVDRALLEAGLDEIEDGDTLYFNTIFQLKVYGVVQGKQYYSLSSIKNAACWRNPNDFGEHFDIGIKFRSTKYPVTLEYRTVSNELLKEKKLGNKKAGESVSVTIDGKKNFDGTQYLLCKSYYINLSKPEKKKNVIKATKETCGNSRIQSGKVKIGGMKIIAYMKKKPDDDEEKIEIHDNPEEGTPPIPTEVIEKEAELYQVSTDAVLKAEKKDSEEYDVTLAIPSGENLYAYGTSDDALLEYKFTKYEGSIVYQVKIDASYTLRWKEESEDGWNWESRTTDGSTTVYVKRTYSYFVVDYFNYYTADKMEIKNEVLPSGSVLMSNSSDKNKISYRYQASQHEYPLKETVTIHLGNSTQVVSNAKSHPVYLNYQQIAENKVGEVETKNDYLEFNGEIILDNKVCKTSTDAPALPEIVQEKAVFYKDGLTIPKNKENKEYQSEGYVYYKNQVTAVEGASSEETNHAQKELVLGIDEINSVFVHTPVVCQGKITDTSSLCQSVTPNPARCQLVLDTEFLVSVSCYAQHLPIQGYGTRNYQKYAKKIEVSFPFDVYNNETFCPSGSWNTVSDGGTYYLPIWVKEGEYSVSFRVTAQNASAQSEGMETANLDPSYYVAASSVPVEISGRMYGLKNYDITDYPLWKNVFREQTSGRLSGTAYYVGTKNQNGADTGLNSIYTLPILAGSHPDYENTGYLKTGYILRYSLKTIGSFYHEEDGILLEPEFYFVDKNGENRERVDIYYDESIEGTYRKLIRIGSKRDQLNTRTLSLGTDGMSVEEAEIKNTAIVKKTGWELLKEKETVWYGYQDNLVSSALQTFCGEGHMQGRNKELQGISSDNVMRSKQTWYFEYYLPASYHIAPYGYDVDGYAKQYPVDFQEEFWKKEGFLIINMRLYAVCQGEKKLSYANEENAENGYCNMWKTEGFSYERTDENGINFHLQDGDFAVFYYGKRQSASSGDDYASGGTH